LYKKCLIYNALKRFYLASLFSALLSPALAQSNYHLISGGVGAGATYTFTDVQKGAFSFATQVALDYNFTPFITAGLEFQTGSAKGGNAVTDPHGREFVNAYSAFMLNTKVRAGQFTDFYYNNFLNYTKGAYIGTGVGMVQSKMSKIVRQKEQPDGSIYTFPGLDEGSSAVIPVNLGIDFYFPDDWGDIRYVLNINYQTNFVLADNFDGYNDPKIYFKNNASDIYNFFSIGIKYNFGPKGLTSKTIR
jgi:hypothetical protein